MFIDLFDPQLPIITKKTVEPGTQAFLYDIKRVTNKNKPQVLATAARIYGESIQNRGYSFIAKSPTNTSNTMRILLPAKPVLCSVTDEAGNNLKTASWEWDNASKTCKLIFDNSPEGIKVSLKY